MMMIGLMVELVKWETQMGFESGRGEEGKKWWL
jgi:hypothetical protein